ncbi:TetR family transcriptional regulator [Nocardia puris]|uniref:TetR family transcriptional regulator n=1 Tax=Nocardia puris TaxID=208602 RepID=A0A366DU94_9NOCA|nr:QsdR family transcriptional regulator [Nocardia puris]MBF6210245.1 TetR family transcriptional regulator [Nocardia puris]MBF6367321.1 TetR family transcriptional regulator [Nocardia puris]MBF6457506.1 TetR family transcriptional regulator [Nocardia puris]RBO93663.1 TetR family transcriptional regulator [Nocardia puris]
MTTAPRPAATRSPGRPASATREEVIALTRRAFLAGERVDVQAIAAELGLSRASIYRWFGSRDGLLGAMLVQEYKQMIARADAKCRTRGARRILEVLDRVARWEAVNEPFRRYFENEPMSGLRILTASDGPVQPHAVAAVAELIAKVEDEDGYDPVLERDLLAYTLVRLGEAFLYTDTAAGIRNDVDRLHEVQRVLLGLPSSD